MYTRIKAHRPPQIRSAAPASELLQSRPLTDPQTDQQLDHPDSQPLDLEEHQARAARLGHHFSRIPVHAPDPNAPAHPESESSPQPDPDPTTKLPSAKPPDPETQDTAGEMEVQTQQQTSDDQPPPADGSIRKALAEAVPPLPQLDANRDQTQSQEERKDDQATSDQPAPQSAVSPAAQSPDLAAPAPDVPSPMSGLASSTSTGSAPGSDQTHSPEITAEQTQADAAAQTATQQLKATESQTVRLAATGISFASPKPSPPETGDTFIARQIANPAADQERLEQHRVSASAFASQFLSTAAGRVQSITQLGQTLGPRIDAATQTARATIQSGIGQRQAALKTEIAGLINQAQTQGDSAQAQVQSQFQSTTTAIDQTTTAARTQIEAERNTALTQIEAQATAQTRAIDTQYAQADQSYRAAGPTVGEEAMGLARQRQQGYLSQRIFRDDSLLDGNLTDRRMEAKAQAAIQVGEAYQGGFAQEANTQADQAQAGKAKDLEAVQAVAQQSQQAVDQHHQATLHSLETAQTQATTQAQQTQISLSQTIQQAVQSTLQRISQQEAAQGQLITGFGQRQIKALDRDAQTAKASLQGGIDQAAASLQGVLEQVQSALQGLEAPDLEALGLILGELEAQVQTAEASVQTQSEQGISATAQGIAQGGQQASGALQTLTQQGIQEASATGEGLSTTLSDLVQAAIQGFAQLQSSHSGMVAQTQGTASAGFDQIAQGTQTAYDQLSQALASGIEQSVAALQEGLRGELGRVEATIQEEAEKAAAQVQPRWKGILKIVLVIAVIVVVALVIGPAVIGAVGAAAGALGASAGAASAIGAIAGGAIVGAASGAVIQMGNNLIDGRDLMEGVGQAAVVGAIGGALGGAGGVLGNSLGAAGQLGSGMTQSMMKFGIDTAFDVAGGIAGDLAVGNPLTLEGILIGAGIGAAVSISTANLSNLGRLGRGAEGIQSRSYDLGSRVGQTAGTRVADGLGIPRPSSPVDVPRGGLPSSPSEAATPVPPRSTETPTGRTGDPTPVTDPAPSGARPTDPSPDLPSAPRSGPSSPEPIRPPQESSTEAPSGSRPEVEGPNRPTETSETATSHPHAAEVEPGVVAKTRTEEGHEIKVTRDGQIKRCSDCRILEAEYKAELEANPDYQQRLEQIKAIEDPDTKAEQARLLDLDLHEIRARTAGLTPEQAAVSKRTRGDTPDRKPRQQTDDLDQIYREAAAADVELKQLTEEIAAQTGGEAGFRPGGLKGRDRAQQKIDSDYEGDASQLVDVAGAKLVFDTVDDLYKALDLIRDRGLIIRFKDRFVKPQRSGYRDILMNVELSNGHVAELRLHLRSIDDAAKHEHLLYQERRTIEAEAETENRPLTPEEAARIETLLEQGSAVYDDAWKNSVETTDSASKPHGNESDSAPRETADRETQPDPVETPPNRSPVEQRLDHLRQSLTTPEAQQMFDATLSKLGPDRAVRAFEGMSQSKDGLEGQLLRQAQKQAGATRSPFGDAVEGAKDLLADTNQLKASLEHSQISGSEGWLRRLRPELSRLQKMTSGQAEASSSEVQSVRNNIEGIRHEMLDAQGRGADTRANVDITYGNNQKLDIDNISNQGQTWTEVKAKEPFTTGSSNWSEEIKPKAEKMLQAGAEHGVTDLRFSFPKGVDPSIKTELEAMGFTVEGPVKPVHDSQS